MPLAVRKLELYRAALADVLVIDWFGHSFTDAEGNLQQLEAVAYSTGKFIVYFRDFTNDISRTLFKGYWHALTDPDMAYDYASQIHFGGDTLPSKKAFHELSEVLSRCVDRIRETLEKCQRS